MTLYATVRRLFDESSPVLSSGPVAASPTKNEDELRADAEAILRAAVQAVEPQALVERALESHRRGIPAEGRVWLVGFGKAAVPMARGAHRALGDRIAGGVLVAPLGDPAYIAPHIDVFRGSHPIPDPACVAGSRAIRQLARDAGEDDTLLCLISGGGSSLLTLPPDELPLEDVQLVTDLMIRAGAPIGALNAVRKHLDVLKGGQLAREAAPARVLALVLSDVVGDPLDVIASGPVSPDPTRFTDAVAALHDHGVWPKVPLAARGYLDRGVCGEIPDTPKRGERGFLRTTCEVIGSSRTAAAAACAEAEQLGYEAQVLSNSLTGEARAAGRFLAESARVLRGARSPERRPVCGISTGETTVTVLGAGRGGRNQELALGAALALDGVETVLVASMGTDGIDGPTDAAGAIATGSTARRVREAGLDGEAALAGNDAYTVFAALDDLIVSGPTGTNVADIQVVLIG